MESFITLLLILLVVTAAVVIACRAIHNRERQQQIQPKAVMETQRTVILEHPIAAQKSQPTVIEETPLTAPEEIEQITTEEAQPGVMQETQPPATTETQLTAVEGTQSIIVQRTQPTAEGETQRLAAEQARSTAADVRQPTSESRRPKPIERGGRPRDSTDGHKEQPPRKPKIRTPKPEIVCWKRERQWLLMVEVPEELLENPSLTVFQNGLPLPKDESEETCWRLAQVFGEVIVRWNEEGTEREDNVGLGHEDYLLFKLGGRNLDQGRLVRFPSSGSYLVIAPDAWERDEALSGPPPAMPEPVSLDGYKAHFFDLGESGNRKIAFRLLDAESKIIESKARRFELVGTRLEDASDRMGPLFGSDLPRIRALDTQAWKNVGTIVVGEEGRGRGRWRMLFTPDLHQTEQDLPPEVAARKSGWYFLRFYDGNGYLIESLDFRFISCLKQIVLPESQRLPSEGGHRPVYVEFVHDPDCFIQAVDESSANIQLKREHDRTIITIPPDPSCDQSRWLICPKDGSPVEIVILVERIWWALAEEDNPPSEWTDKRIELSRKDFTATSSKALWLRLPKRRWVDNIKVGFAKHKARQFPVKVWEKAIAIPLRDFGDAQELSKVGTVSLYVYNIEATPVADVIVKACCKFCDFSSSHEEDVISHIESSHLDKVFLPLTYQEMCKLDRSLPPKIYKCGYCDYYVAANDPRNPTSDICNHIEKVCANVPRGQGPPRIVFRIVTDVNEIRENVINSLRSVHKCSLCGAYLTEVNSQARMQHLVERHKESLISLQ